jgi:hypothetical protein
MHEGGRPPKFTDPAEFERIALDYFAQREAENKPYTVNGLALALGMCRQTLLNYGENEKFLDAVKKVRGILEDHWEARLGGTANAAGTIFWLKNQGWTDRQVLAGDPEAPLHTVPEDAIDARINELLRKEEARKRALDANPAGQDPE